MDAANFFRAKNLYWTRSFRGAQLFGINRGLDGKWHMLMPNEYVQNANSWHYCPLPDDTPRSATVAFVYGMFVGGVKPGSQAFMLHLDFEDPALHPSTESALDWPGQGDFYFYYNSANERAPFGMFPVPCAENKILLRWKIDNDYNNAFGINLRLAGVADALGDEAIA